MYGRASLILDFSDCSCVNGTWIKVPGGHVHLLSKAELLWAQQRAERAPRRGTGTVGQEGLRVPLRTQDEPISGPLSWESWKVLC